MRPSGGYLLVVVEDLEQTPEGRAIRDRHDTGPMATDREINCPSAGKSVSAYRETDMSASTLSSKRRQRRITVGHGTGLLPADEWLEHHPSCRSGTRSFIPAPVTTTS